MAMEQIAEQAGSGFSFGKSNDEQKKAITTTDGPVLVLAGPGTGKTHTLVKRIAYLLLEKHVKPSQLFVSTFTDKAVKELVTRLSNELPADFVFNPDEMYLGTFHSLCLRMIREYADASQLPKSYKTADGAALDYLLFTNLNAFWQPRNESGRCYFSAFLNLFNGEPDKREKYKHDMWVVSKIKSAVSAAAEEGVSPQMLLGSDDPQARVIGIVYATYETLLAENGLLDFGKMQLEALRILKDNPEVLADLRQRLSYFLIDEYQDTNRVQEEMLFLLAGKSRNIFVVGDDDQGLYRFRGATVRNILDFEDRVRMHLGASDYESFHLEDNYRSEPGIIDFCNGWMSEIRVPGYGGFSWEKDGVRYRAQKRLIPGNTQDEAASTVAPKRTAPAVCKMVRNGEAWRKGIVNLVRSLKDGGAIHDYNQVAFLTNSTVSPHCLALQEDMERAGIGVYSPRSQKFFDQQVIKQLFGMLLLLFKSSAGFTFDTTFQDKATGALKQEYAEYTAYAKECMEIAQGLVDADGSLKSFVVTAQKNNCCSFERADYGYADLLYEAFAFDPFKSILDVSLRSGISDQRDVRNIAKFMKLLASFESLANVDKLCDLGKKAASVTCQLIGKYFHYLYESGVNEYEDAVEYAPSGCVSFLTIHQSKGLEFPVAIVDISGAAFFKDSFPSKIERIVKGAAGKMGAVNDQANCHDFWRLYYTAFSRAQNLLVVTRNGDIQPRFGNSVTTAFDPYLQEGGDRVLPDFDANGFFGDGDSLEFAEVKASQLKPVFSFTTHLSLYESCPRKYKFYRELDFPSKKATGMHFGTAVHQTIEDVNNAMMAGRDRGHVDAELEGWLNANCAALELSEKATFDESMRARALEQVKRYIAYFDGRWEDLVAAEMPISLAREKYIAKGSIDLVKKSHDDDSLVLLDFKTGKKPTSATDTLFERYKGQLNLYASLVSAQKDEDGHSPQVSFTQLYYFGADEGDPTVTLECTDEGLKSAQRGFDEIAERIIDKDFEGEARDPKTCDDCDFRFHCGKAPLDC